MEHSISSLTFKGSISEAIFEAKKHRKLFVVYLSGEDAESVRLETSTWTESNVAESVSKFCILLQIIGGSADGAHFSAISFTDPQKSVPCITVVGYNGVQLWQNEGFVSAEILASSLEKAWLSLHVQETTATFLTAALASKESVPSTSGVPNIALFEQGSSSGTNASSTDIHVEPSEATPLVTPEIIEENNKCECTVESGKASSKSVCANEPESGEGERSVSSTQTSKELFDPVMVDLDCPGVGHLSSSVEDRSPAPEESINVIDHHPVVSEETSQLIAYEANEAVQDKMTESRADKKGDALDICTSVSKSNDVHLNIRLPDGANLQEKFSVTSKLRMVKEYVDKHQSSGIGSYDLAIPYPRKVFNDQDLSKSFSELGLFNRQALIVIPHQRATAQHKGGSSSHDETTSTTDGDSLNESDGGYFSYVKRILSYINPFSYLGVSASSPSSSEESQNSMWQYGPNPALRNNLAGTERPYNPYSPNQNTAGDSENGGKSRKPTSSRFGSNIHTLRHDEDDGRFSDRNAFWNGNSTQYGGNNDGK